MKNSKKNKKTFVKPELIKYGSLEDVTLVSNPSTSVNVSCSVGGGCTAMSAGTAIPSFCSYC